MLLGVAEPATIQAVTTVHALVLAQEDFAKVCSDPRDGAVAVAAQSKSESPTNISQEHVLRFPMCADLRKVAYDTLGFVLERVEAEAKQEHCDQHLKIEYIKAALLAHKPPPGS